MFSQKVEYALRAVMHLAARMPAHRTVDQIAKATNLPPAYLAKVIQELVHAGIARSQRGLGGGITLSRPPAETTMLDVVNAVEPIRRMSLCPLGGAAEGLKLCGLHRRIESALGHIEQAFRATTLADVIDDHAEGEACPFPRLPIAGG